MTRAPTADAGAARNTLPRRRLAGTAGPNRAAATPARAATAGDRRIGATARPDEEVGADAGTDVGTDPDADVDADLAAAGDDADRGAAVGPPGRSDRPDCTAGPCCAETPAVRYDAAATVGATTRPPVGSGVVQVAPRTSRGARRSSLANAPRRATAPGRGSGCHGTYSSRPAPRLEAVGGNDSARGIVDAALARSARERSSPSDSSRAASGRPGPVTPGPRDVAEDAGDEVGVSASLAITASASGRVAPTCRPGPEACAERRALPPPVDGDGGPTVDRLATARARSRRPNIGPAARTSSGLATNAASVTMRCVADDGPVSTPAGDRRPRDVARGRPRGPAAAVSAANPLAALRITRRCAACMLCSSRDGVGRMRVRSRSAIASHMSSCIPTGKSPVPATCADTFCPITRRAKIDRPFKNPNCADFRATTPARWSSAIRVRRRACIGWNRAETARPSETDSLGGDWSLTSTRGLRLEPVVRDFDLFAQRLGDVHIESRSDPSHRERSLQLP